MIHSPHITNGFDAVLDIDTIIERIGFGPFQLRLLLIIGLPLFADCMEVFLITFIAPDVQRDFGISDWTIALLAASVFVGMFIGAILFGALSDNIGRERSITCAASLVAIGGLMNSASEDPVCFACTRLICGMGIGGAHTGVTLFAEFLPTQKRSLYLSAIQFCGALGTVVECVLAWALQNHSWRWLVRCTAIPAALSAVLCVCLPKSPRFSLIKNRPQEAVTVLRQVARYNGCPHVLPKDFTIRAVVSENERWSMPRRFRALFADAQLRVLTFALAALWFTVSFSYYGVAFLSATIETTSRQTLYRSLVIVSLAEIPAYYIAHKICTSRGRRDGMTMCTIFGAVTLAVLAAQDYIPFGVLVPAMFLARLTCAVFFAIVVLYTPEAFPTSVRSTASGLTNAFSRAAGALTPFVSFRLRSVSAVAAGSMYILVLCMGAVATRCLPFETKGRVLRDVLSP